MRSVYWLRSDLRILDNEALLECLNKKQDVLFVFAQTKSLNKAGRFRKEFIEQSFSALKAVLEEKGFTVLKTQLVFSDFISTVFKSYAFDSVYFTQEYAWDERQEEILVQEYCRKNQIVVHSFDQSTLIAEKNLPFSLDQMPFIFTDFRKRIESQLRINPLLPVPFTTQVKNLDLNLAMRFSGGEDQGIARLHSYLWKTHAVEHYKQTRNGLINFDDSSKLSAWLNSGCLSPRSIYYELKKYENEVCENESTYWLFFELLWRDYFKFFSLRFGKKIFLSTGINPGSSLNGSNIETFASWCEGKTQDAFINANMNELNQTGWMSNRGRQNVASYLIHDLGLNWTWGAAYFEDKLIDYDPDLNWGNWLYLSGRGSDPRARKFNLIKQAETYDPQGEYRRRWT